MGNNFVIGVTCLLEEIVLATLSGHFIMASIWAIFMKPMNSSQAGFSYSNAVIG